MFVPRLSIDVTLPDLQVKTTLPQVTIDAQQARSDIGLKPIGPMMRERAARAQAAGAEAIGEIAREGDRLAQVEVSTNAIAEIAAEKWPKLRELNVDAQPKHRPLIDVEEGEITVQLQPGRVRVQLPHLTGPGARIDVRA